MPITGLAVPDSPIRQELTEDVHHAFDASESNEPSIHASHPVQMSVSVDGAEIAMPDHGAAGIIGD